MSRRPKAASPILGAAATAIGRASRSLVFTESEFSHTFEVDVAAVTPNPDQPRRSFDGSALAALSETLRAEGQLQPILVRRDPQDGSRWVIVAGERRWRAAGLIGWTRILAAEFLGDAEVATLLENLQRVDLSPIDEARGIRQLLEGKGWTQDQAAKALGKTKSEISGTLRILRLPEAVLEAVLTSEHPPAKNVLIELARIEDGPALARLASLAAKDELTVKAVRIAREAGKPSARASQGQGADAWAFVGQAAKLLDRIAKTEVAVDAQRVASLRSLRDSIDALLSRVA